MGSARGPRAGLGGSPKPSSLTLLSGHGLKKLVEQGCRRAAENRTPAACSPRTETPCALPDQVAQPDIYQTALAFAHALGVHAALQEVRCAAKPVAFDFALADDKIRRFHGDVTDEDLTTRSMS